MPNELLQPSNQQPDEGKDKIVRHGEIMDSAEDYLRRYAEDSDDAERYLETIIDDPMERLLIKLDAGLIGATLTRFRAQGKVDHDKIGERVEVYKATFREALEKQKKK